MQVIDPAKEFARSLAKVPVHETIRKIPAAPP
jgi:hypothetical protein